MCGIAGIWRHDARARGLEPDLRLMLAQIAHRGPDDEGTWQDERAGIGLGQRRLAIIDLSPGGHQPMHSASGRLTIVFNGEIYNYLAIRAELEAQGTRFRSTSDTEVMLEAFERWGLEAGLRRLAGMFAFALWDRDAQRLVLARDRLGKKPLYYARRGDTLAFASELRPLEQMGLARAVDRGALTLLLRNGYIPQPHAIWSEVRKLPPAHLLELGVESWAKAEPRPYWNAREVAAAGLASPGASEAALLDQVERTLREAVQQRMLADVPLGAFLSGGIDSSLVVGMMQEQSARPVKTFTIGFHEAEYDEAAHAKRVAEHLGTEHTELYVTPEEAMKVIPRLARIYDEPFADSSQIPTFLVSQLARRHVTVALSGDGGDELFGGYNRYLFTQNLWRRLSRAPLAVRAASSRAILAVSPEGWARAYGLARPLIPLRRRVSLPGDKAHKLARIVGARSIDDLYVQLLTSWHGPARAVRGGYEPPSPLATAMREAPGEDPLERMMYVDSVSYLPDDILAKVDRASMAVSLETRAPLLDHRLYELSWRLPMRMKVRDGQGKWALRQLLHKRVPRELIERPKMGFGIPVAAWLRGPMQPWAEALLDERRLREEGFFDAGAVRELWQEHLSGKRNWEARLWPVLMFQLWLEAHPSILRDVGLDGPAAAAAAPGTGA